MTCGPFTHISPGSPKATSSPSAPTNLISVDEAGRPIEPLYFSWLYGLMVTNGAHSVKPYPSKRRLLVTRSQCSATGRCTDIPPPKPIFNALKSSWSKPGVCNKPLNKVFTPVITVNLYLANSLTKPGMSRGLVINKLVPPKGKNAKQLEVSA